MNTYQNDKVKVLGEKKDIDKQIESLSKRQRDLKAEHEKSKEEVERLQQSVTDALIAGTDHTAQAIKLQNEKTKLEAFETAIAQITKDIDDRKNKSAEKETVSRLMDFYSDAEVMRTQVSATIVMLKTALEKFAQAKATFIEVNKSGFNLDNYDETSLTLKVYQSLEQKLTLDGGGISATLWNLETAYKNFFTQAHKQ